MIRYFMIASGKVQQVGFRHFCYIHAVKLNISGYAKNLSNKMVEINIQGKKENLLEFIKIIQKGNRFINIENLSIKEISTIENENNFLCL